jgi:hypothetical protein
MDIGTVIGLLGVVLFLLLGVWQLYLRLRLAKWVINVLLSLFRGSQR